MDAGELKNGLPTLLIAVLNLRFAARFGFERHIQKQLIRSSASVAANYRAACLAHPKAAFSSKISIVVEDVDETSFWIEFLIQKGIVSQSYVKNCWKRRKS